MQQGQLPAARSGQGNRVVIPEKMVLKQLHSAPLHPHLRKFPVLPTPELSVISLGRVRSPLGSFGSGDSSALPRPLRELPLTLSSGP